MVRLNHSNLGSVHLPRIHEQLRGWTQRKHLLQLVLNHFFPHMLSGVVNENCAFLGIVSGIQRLGTVLLANQGTWG